MSHFSLDQLRYAVGRSRAQIPVSREEQQQVGARTVALANFKYRLAPGDIIPTVSVDKYQPTKAMLNEVLNQPAQHIEVSARWSGEGSREVEVMIGVAQPEQGCEQDLI